MIYVNFLYFIIAIALLSSAPSEGGKVFTHGQNVLVIGIIIALYWHFTRYKFLQLRILLNNNVLSVEEAKKKYFSRLNINFIFSLVLFTLEIYLFDLKVLLLKIPAFTTFDFLFNLIGLSIFILHLAIAWYWGFRAMGDVLDFGESAGKYVWSHTKFNLVIIIPWIIFYFVFDLLLLLWPEAWVDMNTPIFQLITLNIFIVLLAIFGPVLISWLWNCKPLPDSELKNKILTYCNSQGVKFKNILDWNILSMSLVTAGVVGLVSRFRYLLITPALMDLLNEDEIMAVTSHEAGHVKKRHHLFYMVFFIGFLNILYIWVWNVQINSASLLGITGTGDSVAQSFFYIFVPLFILILFVHPICFWLFYAKF